MRVMGADPSSSCAGLVLSSDKTFVDKRIWKPKPKMPRGEALLAYYDYTLKLLAIWQPDMAIVAQLSNVRGLPVVRALSHFEGATLMACARLGILTFQIKDSTARHHVLGLPITASKDDAIAAVKHRWPELKWSRGDAAGDEIDAFVFSLAEGAVGGRS